LGSCRLDALPFREAERYKIRERNARKALAGLTADGRAAGSDSCAVVVGFRIARSLGFGRGGAANNRKFFI
jgi:hypothetical protein